MSSQGNVIIMGLGIEVSPRPAFIQNSRAYEARGCIEEVSVMMEHGGKTPEEVKLNEGRHLRLV